MDNVELTETDIRVLNEVKAKINEISKRYKGTPVGSVLLDIEYKIDELRFRAMSNSASTISMNRLNRLIKGQ